MSSVLKSKNYEVPACTVCMEDMVEQLSVTNCGHVFHTHCIAQSLEYRGACPNCRKRAAPKELKEITYTVAVNKVEDKDRIQFLESLKQADQENYIKLIAENDEMYRELKIKTNKIENLKEEVQNKENLLTSQGEMIRALNKEKNEFKIERQGLIMEKEATGLENEKLIKQNDLLERKVNNLEKQLQDYERLKRIVENATDNEDEFLKSLRDRSSYQDQAKTFYEFLRIKKGELKKSKDELQRIALENEHNKQRVQVLEAALKKQQSVVKPMEKPIEKRMDTILRKHTSIEEKIFPERQVKTQRTQESSTDHRPRDILSKKSTLNDDGDLAGLGEDLLNSSIMDTQPLFSQERTQPIHTQDKDLFKKAGDTMRPIRSIVNPIGKLSQSTSRNSSQQGNLAVRSNMVETMKRKSGEVFPMKKVKLDDELSYKPNVQQKLSFFGSNN